MMKKIFWLIPLALSTVFCSFGATLPPPTEDVAAIVNATLTAVAAQAQPTATHTELPTAIVVPSETPTVEVRGFFPETGLVSGKLTYPSEGVPPMRVVAFRLDDGSASYTNTAAGQVTYELELPEGDYNIVAYSIGGDGFPSGLAGGYTKSVLCGLTADCTDHTLIVVTVVANTTLTDINPGDWYAGEAAFPPMPSP